MYKDLKFNSEKEFQTWLRKTAKYKIEFEDNGQDFSTWWLDERGEVLYSDLQSSIWDGQEFFISSIKKDSYPRFKNRGGSLAHKIKKVIEL